MTQRDENLRRAVDEQLARRQRRRPGGLVGLLVMGGTVGLLFVVPVLLGVYAGRWIDEHVAGYSIRWTVSLLVLGIAMGAYNVYRFLKRMWNE